MSGYGQFCAVARAHEVVGGWWTLLVVSVVVRELSLRRPTLQRHQQEAAPPSLARLTEACERLLLDAFTARSLANWGVGNNVRLRQVG